MSSAENVNVELQDVAPPEKKDASPAAAGETSAPSKGNDAPASGGASGDEAKEPLLGDPSMLEMTPEEREFLHGTFGAIRPERVRELTTPHEEKIQRIFRLVDVDGGNTVSRDECTYLAQCMTLTPRQARRATDELFRDLDTDRSNSLDRNEWLVFFAVLIDKSKTTEEKMDEFLDQLIQTLSRDRQPLTWGMKTYYVFVVLSLVAFAFIITLLVLTFKYNADGDWKSVDDGFKSLVDRGAIKDYNWTIENNTSTRIAACFVGMVAILCSPFVSYPRQIVVEDPDGDGDDVAASIGTHWSRRATRVMAACSALAVVLQFVSIIMDAGVLALGINGCDQACDMSCDPLRPDNTASPNAAEQDQFTACQGQDCVCGLQVAPRSPEIQTVTVFTASADAVPGGDFLLSFLSQPAAQEISVNATADEVGNVLADIQLTSTSTSNATTLGVVYPMDITVSTAAEVAADGDDAARFNVRSWTITFNNAYLDTGPMGFDSTNLTAGTYVDVTAQAGQADATFAKSSNPFDNRAVYASGLIGIGAAVFHALCAAMQVYYTSKLGRTAHLQDMDRMLKDDSRGLSHKNMMWLRSKTEASSGSAENQAEAKL